MVRQLLGLTMFSLLLIMNVANACSNYIAREEGKVAILLTSAHGAGKAMLLPGVPPREGINIKRFVDRADQYTGQLTWDIAESLKQKGLTPFVVVAGIHRSQIDFNRPSEEAYEVEQAEECYKYYHRSVREAVNAIKEKWRYGFMLDVHGQSKHAYEILRGTRNNQTIQQLISRFGGDVTESEEGFFTVLREKNYDLHPRRTNREEYYYGGFTLMQYGSHLPTGIDAMQVEVHRDIRISKDRRDTISNDLAEAIQRFYLRYYSDSL